MIVLTKKQILKFLSSVSAIVLVLTVINSAGLNGKELHTVQTVSLPVTNKVIVLDAGHGIPDERIILLTPTE